MVGADGGHCGKWNDTNYSGGSRGHVRRLLAVGDWADVEADDYQAGGRRRVCLWCISVVEMDESSLKKVLRTRWKQGESGGGAALLQMCEWHLYIIIYVVIYLTLSST